VDTWSLLSAFSEQSVETSLPPASSFPASLCSTQCPCMSRMCCRKCQHSSGTNMVLANQNSGRTCRRDDLILAKRWEKDRKWSIRVWSTRASCAFSTGTSSSSASTCD